MRSKLLRLLSKLVSRIAHADQVAFVFIVEDETSSPFGIDVVGVAGSMAASVMIGEAVQILKEQEKKPTKPTKVKAKAV